MRIPIAITGCMRRVLGCEGTTLETVFVEGEASRATVFVFSVDPTRKLVQPTVSVLKFSEKQYAIPRVALLHLATPSYFREHQGDGVGIRDEQEARYHEDVRSFLTRHGTMDATSVALESGHATYGVDDFWMFCTFATPMSNREREQLRKEFEAGCITTIPGPSEFARELGAAFATHSSWADVYLSALDKLTRKLPPSEIGDKVVWVYHGPVCYSDDAQILVESFAELHRPAVVSLLKRQTFARHKEYRFIVKINGKPRRGELLLPILPEIRRLAKIDWKGR